MTFLVRDQYDPQFGHLFLSIQAGALQPVGDKRNAEYFPTRAAAEIARQSTEKPHLWEVVRA